jgi:hypothetical protein
MLLFVHGGFLKLIWWMKQLVMENDGVVLEEVLVGRGGAKNDEFDWKVLKI